MALHAPRPGLLSRVRVWHAAVLWALLMSPLAWWGLPSSRDDALLFGGAAPWPAERYGAAEALRQRGQRAGGADTDLNPIADPSAMVDLTADDAARGEILRRYRLYSRQPDEMITFMALARMRPRQLDFDPRLYQYGGAYVYMVGGAIGLTSLVGLTWLTADVGVYLEQPDLFARFYVVARLISLAFAAAMLIAAARIADRIHCAAADAVATRSAREAGALLGRSDAVKEAPTGGGAMVRSSFAGSCAAGWVAALLLACCPVFITAALEAKPHLPSACMLLWAVLAACDYCDSGRRSAAIRFGLLSGAALGFVLTGALAAVLWPVTWWAARGADAGGGDDAIRTRHASGGRERQTNPQVSAWRSVAARPGQDLLIAAAIALAVYAATNPYVLINLLFHRDVLLANLGNSTAMYSVGRPGAGALRVGQLLFAGFGPLVPVGLLGLVLALRRAGRPAALLAALAGAVVVMGVLLGAGKPDEFARFLLVPAAALAIGTALIVAAVRWAGLLTIAAVLAMALVPGGTWTYLRAFYIDAWTTNEARHVAAERLRELLAEGDAIGVLQVPAPYAVPPLDFARRTVLLLPSSAPPSGPPELPRWLVYTDSARSHLDAWWQREYRPVFSTGAAEGATGIAWADKPTFVYARQ